MLALSMRRVSSGSQEAIAGPLLYDGRAVKHSAVFNQHGFRPAATLWLLVLLNLFSEDDVRDCFVWPCPSNANEVKDSEMEIG